MMPRTFSFQDCGVVIEGDIDTSTPPIGNLRSLAKYATHISRLNLTSDTCSTPYFNPEPLESLLSKELPKLRELRIWVYPPTVFPFPITISHARHPQLKSLSLIGVQIDMRSSLKTLNHLELCNYPPGVRPLERFRFTALLKTGCSLRSLVLRWYLTNAYSDEKEMRLEYGRLFSPSVSYDEYPGTRIDLPRLKTFVIEDIPRNTAQMIDTWMGQRIPTNTHVVATYGPADFTNRWSTETGQGSLFIDAIAQRSPQDSHPIPPGVFDQIKTARLSFDGGRVTLACDAYSEHERRSGIPLVIQLQLLEFERLDRQSRVTLHAMALRSVRWVLCDAARSSSLRALEIEGVSDEVGVAAWIELLDTIRCVPEPALRTLTLIQDPRKSSGQAKEDLLRALRVRQRDSGFTMPAGLTVIHTLGTKSSEEIIFEVQPTRWTRG
ncbi:hypothetical protein L226DRAFT_203732 [Lentinus tigrinus ALCF2SS1-7]|uniref:Uncharacterized protein n=1 Tax=Lentinus tigrinus ALCF2SS1-6 TaxID=1328759 RepID=A0A5C2SU77_9APHY|nr:hypothetical protein L227DRAFT_649309 [Lentinus tigrinus ALCF2SS1-6]RPD80559.1 hypothetical protein L226DRAFT_203732 [Lentinus tigrinus ALCF2SS1-7]